MDIQKTPLKIKTPNRSSNESVNTSNAAATRTQRQLSHLNSQVAQLHANICDFNEQIAITTRQYQDIQTLGKIHGSLFMASRTVFENDNFDADGDQQEVSN